MILLISAKDSLIEAFSAILPASIPLVHLLTVAEVEPFLSSPVDEQLEPILIVVDAQKDHQVVSDCHQLRHKKATIDIPIIAIIEQPADRQLVLEAGADDYLFHPLLPVEVQARLGNYTHSSFHSSNIWIDAFHQMNKGGLPGQVLSQNLESLTQTFKASAAWLFSFHPQKGITLLSSYNLPPLLQQDNMLFNDEAQDCLEAHQKNEASRVQIISSTRLQKADQQDTNGLTTYLSVLLNSHQDFVGVLNLAYTESPQISRTEKQSLAILGQDIGVLLEIFHLQEEAQIYATQHAFIILLARTISEPLDVNTILSLSLEQIVPLLNASSGDIWLLSLDGQWLELALSLSSTPSQRLLPRRAKGQGLIGWVADQNRSLCINENILEDSRFDPEVDGIKNRVAYSMLAVPLRHRETIIGVVAIYNEHNLPFANPDIILLEGIASLTASAITNARLMQELHDYASQQRALYEMSQQIATGLDLQATLNRVLTWIGRLCEVEVGLLWLTEEPQNQDNDAVDRLCLVATLNAGLLWKQQIIITLEEGLVGWSVSTGQIAMVNDLANDSRFDPSITNMLGITARNAIVVPMIYHDQAIGAISMFNKIGGSFEEVDLILLSTAIEIIAVAVGNARLHTQTVGLMKEQERLYQQMLQTERLATVGRLTASLSHEINNPMQTIQTALHLGKEELDNREKLTTYIDMSLKESERVVQLVKRMQQIYRPKSDVPETLDLNRLLQESITIAHKELRRRHISLETDLASELPPLTVIANQMYLVFLSLILNLGDAIGAIGGGQLQVRSYALPHEIHVEFITNVPIASVENWVIFEKEVSQNGRVPSPTQKDASFSLSLSQDIIIAHGGTLEIQQQDNQTLCHIQLPLYPTNLPENHKIHHLFPHGDYNEPTSYSDRR